jgi:hypothetical protein
MGQIGRLLVIPLVALLGQSLAVPCDADDARVSDLKQIYKEYDFLPALSGCKAKLTGAPRYGFPEKTLKHVPDAELTTGEIRLLGQFSLSSGATMFGFAGYLNTMNYAAEHGAFPASIFDVAPNLLSSGSITRFKEAEPKYKLFSCQNVINPITGRIYDEINSPLWRKGCFHIERLRWEDYVQRYGNPKMHCTVEPQAWHIMVYGEREGTILQDFVEVKCNELAVPWKGEYGKIPK